MAAYFRSDLSARGTFTSAAHQHSRLNTLIKQSRILGASCFVHLPKEFNRKHSTAIGLRVKDGIVLAVEKLVHSKLLVPGANRRIQTVDRHIGLVRRFWMAYICYHRSISLGYRRPLGRWPTNIESSTRRSSQLPRNLSCPSTIKGLVLF